jgi:hypothetical protein
MGAAMLRINRRQCLAFVAALGLCGCAQFAVKPPTPAAHMDATGMWERRTEEQFFLIVFGSQTTLKHARRTHTWATLVRVKQQPGQQPAIDPITISWLPATFAIHPLSFHVEKGVNVDLHETIEYALANKEEVSLWGPYECRPRLYYRSLVQKGYLESGEIGYQCIDDVGEAARNGNGCDCIHAITDQDPLFSRNRYPLRRFGNAASEFIVKELWRRDLLIQPEQTHDWLSAVLGLDRYPIKHRRYQGAVNERLARETRESTTRGTAQSTNR